MAKPVRISRSKDMDATPDAVWAALARFDQISLWAPDVEHSCYTTQETEGVGAARRVQAGPLALIETVTEWEPGRRLTYSLEGLPPLVRSVTNSWQLEPSGGGTRVTLTSTMQPRAFITGRLGAFVLRRVLDHVSGGLLSGLAEHVGRRTDQARRA